ncbi:MAG: UDP-2,3-diacylglucosamine diphosphatase LpxI [Roseococcus sp.]|nr:UDP-2,3-diacylglucosamine diphosphatase LpxI [Roseococcus sp.]
MKLGLLAGGGPFPARVAEAARARGHEVFVVLLRDFHDDPALRAYPHMEERVGAGGTIIQRLRAEGITHLVLCGKAKRLSPLTLWPDAWMAKVIARLGKAVFAGDDTLLRNFIGILGEEGFEVIAPQSLLPSSTAEAGLLVGEAPDEMARADIIRGIGVLRALADHDVGQSVVVQQGLILGIEAVEGTDALLARAAGLRRDGPGGVLVKLAKPGQELRVDAPVVGSITVRHAAEAGLRGIAIEAGRTILADGEGLLAAARQRGLFVLAMQPEDYARSA